MENALFAKVFVEGDMFAEMAVDGADQTGWEEGVAEILAVEESEARFESNHVAYVKFPIHHSDGSVVAVMVMGFYDGAIAAVVNELYMVSLVAVAVICLVMSGIVMCPPPG